jgi:hypothetical protein
LPPTVVNNVSAGPVNSNNEATVIINKAAIIINNKATVIINSKTAVPVNSKNANTIINETAAAINDIATLSTLAEADLNKAGTIPAGAAATDTPPLVPVGVTNITPVAPVATNQAASIGYADGHSPEQVMEGTFWLLYHSTFH